MYLRLLGVQLNQRYGISATRAALRENKARTLGRLLVMLIVAVAVGSLVWMYVWGLIQIMPAFQMLRMEDLLLGTLLLGSMVFVFVMGLVYLIGTLYFSKDTEFLSSLPIPQRTVFAVKFSQVLLGEIGMGLLVLAPPFIVYGVLTSAGVAYWLRAALVALLAPCIPLAISGALSLLLMRFTALWRRRDLLVIIGSVLVMVAFILGQTYLTAQIPEDITQDLLMTFVAGSAGLLGTLTSAFPPAGWAAQGLISGGGQLWLFAGVSLVALALVVLLSSRLYHSGASAQLETSASTRAVRIEGGAVRGHGPIFALFLREWRTVLRSPVYALNGLLTIIVGPLMLILPRLMSGGSPDDDIMGMLTDMLSGMVDPLYVLLVLAGIIVAMAMINPAVTTSLSREGRLFYLLRTMPVTPARQVMAKFLFGLSVSVLTALAMGVTAMLMLGIPVRLALLATVLGLLVSVAPLALTMLPDILRPKLSWNSETEAIKQNMNSVMGMLIGWAYLALLVFGMIWLLPILPSVQAGVGLVAGASALLAGASLWGLVMAARRSWRVIEG